MKAVGPDRLGARLPEAFLSTGNSSFAGFVSELDASLLPASRLTHMTGNPALSASGAVVDFRASIPHGTTIVALTYPGGVVMAGDRRATAGNAIVMRDIEKVFAADEHAVVGIAGSAGLALELVRLFQVELEHYEKIEGAPLSLEGKANRLATMLRGNLGLAMQGLAVVPMFAGFDLRANGGRIFSYDVTGGRYEEHAFHSVGSGSVFARGSLKKLYRPDLDEQSAVLAALESLYDAADDDSATGGPDLARKIYPVVSVVDADGVRIWDEAQVGSLLRHVTAARQTKPDGPVAPLPRVTGKRAKGE